MLGLALAYLVLALVGLFGAGDLLRKASSIFLALYVGHDSPKSLLR
jgi:hypothetical protein